VEGVLPPVEAGDEVLFQAGEQYLREGDVWTKRRLLFGRGRLYILDAFSVGLLHVLDAFRVGVFEQRIEEPPLVGQEVGVGLLELDEAPIRLAEPALLGDLLDPQVPANGQVDDGGRDVEWVGHLVLERAALPWADVLRWGVFDRR